MRTEPAKHGKCKQVRCTKAGEHDCEAHKSARQEYGFMSFLGHAGNIGQLRSNVNGQ